MSVCCLDRLACLICVSATCCLTGSFRWVVDGWVILLLAKTEAQYDLLFEVVGGMSQDALQASTFYLSFHVGILAFKGASKAPRRSNSVMRCLVLCF